MLQSKLTWALFECLWCCCYRFAQRWCCCCLKGLWTWLASFLWTRLITRLRLRFETKRRCNSFGNQKNTFYCVWAPRFFASQTQERKKQHFAALWTLFTLNLISMNSVAHTVEEWIALFTWTVQFHLHCSHTFFFFYILKKISFRVN